MNQFIIIKKEEPTKFIMNNITGKMMNNTEADEQDKHTEFIQEAGLGKSLRRLNVRSDD